MAAMSVTPPANAAEHARLQSHLRAVLRLKAGCDNQNSVTALTVRAYASIVDEVVADVAGELHRAIATGLDTIDSVSQRVPPADDVIAGYEDAVAAQEAEAERLRAGGFFGEALRTRDPSAALASKPADASAGAVKQEPRAGGDLYGRGPGAAKETAECPVCAQTVAASRFAHHLERCLGKGRLAVRRPASLAAPSKDPPAPRKHTGQSAVGRLSHPIEPNARVDHAPPPAPPRVRFVLNPQLDPQLDPQKARKTKSVASLMGLEEMDDVPLSAIAREARSSRKAPTATGGTRGKEKGDFRAASKATSKASEKSATGVAAGAVAKKGKKTVAGGATAAAGAVAKKQAKQTHKSSLLSKPLGGAFRVSVEAPFGGGGAGNADGETRFGGLGGLGGFGAPAGDSFAFEHERGAGDGSGSTHEDFELLFDVDLSGGATGGGEGVLTGGFRDLFAS